MHGFEEPHHHPVHHEKHHHHQGHHKEEKIAHALKAVEHKYHDMGKEVRE
jgi:hypothetical protein